MLGSRSRFSPFSLESGRSMYVEGCVSGKTGPVAPEAPRQFGAGLVTKTRAELPVSAISRRFRSSRDDSVSFLSSRGAAKALI
jgi:hypothetical protein